MTRTQVYLPDADHRRLRRAAEEQGISMTELVRRLVGAYVTGRRGVAVFPKEAVLRFVALGSSGKVVGAEEHDRALDEAFRAGDLR